jgi:hypothetical protein
MAESADQVLPEAAKLRKDRVVKALLKFSWDNYRLHEVEELTMERGAKKADWVNDLADAVIKAARPISLSELSKSDGTV